MTNPAIPLAVKALRQDPGIRPVDPAEPVVRDDLSAPEFLVGYALQEWRRLVPILVRMRLLSTADVNTLAQYCQAYARWRTAEEIYSKAVRDDPVNKGLMVPQGISKRSKKLVPNPMIALAHNAGWEMVKYGSELGLTPASRARIVSGGAKGGAGKFDGLLVRPNTPDN